MARARKEVQSAARLVEEHARFTFTSSDQVVRRVKAEVERLGIDAFRDSHEHWQWLARLANSLSQDASLWLVDAQGRPVLGSIAFPIEPADLTERHYFQAHKNGDPGPYFGPLYKGKHLGVLRYSISRGIVAPDGGFGGVVLASIDARSFEEIFLETRLGQRASLGAFRMDGEIIVRHPVRESDIGKSGKESVLFREQLPYRDAGLFEAVSPIDGTRRIYAFHTLPEFPVVTGAGMALDEALAPWQRRRNRIAMGTMAALACLGALTVVAHASLRREEEARNALKFANESLERRVEERTRDLQGVKDELARARDFFAASERMFRTALRDSRVAVFSQDMDLRYTWVCNCPAFDDESLLGRTDSEMLSPEDAAAMTSVKRQVLETGQPTRAELTLAPNGRTFAVDLSVEPLKDQDGNPVGIIGSVIDITEERENALALESARWRAQQANEAKSRFLAAASHDLRQPLQATRLFLEILVQALRDHEYGHVARKAIMSLEAGEGLLSALLDVSTLEAGIVRPDIADVPLASAFKALETELGPAAVDKGLRFRVVPTHEIARTDRVLLLRILRNLVSNAIRYTERGGVLVGVRREGPDLLRIEIWDTGTGIPPDKLEMIFEDFYQLKNPERDRTKGLGLGLSVVDRMARLLGHRVSVRSRLGKGSVFALTLPRARR